MNRMVEAVSKNRLAQWYKGTAIQQLRPVDLGELTSQRYWEKWDRVSEKALQDISEEFFRRVWDRERPSADCLLFDTTNYYTFMSSRTESELSRRGKSKAGRHHLRQPNRNKLRHFQLLPKLPERFLLHVAMQPAIRQA